MPIYEYECEQCGRQVEHLLTTSEATVVSYLECGKCGGRMKKLLSTTAEPIIHGFSEKNGYSNAEKKKKKPKE